MKPTETSSWSNALRIYLHPRVIGMLSLGFSAGLPLLLILGTLSFWLREAGIDRATIGHLSWIGLAYSFKWLWSPLVDRMPLPVLTRLLGRRRSWLFLSQIIITIALIGMAFTDPLLNLTQLVFLRSQSLLRQQRKTLPWMLIVSKRLPLNCKVQWLQHIKVAIGLR